MCIYFVDLLDNMQFKLSNLTDSTLKIPKTKKFDLMNIYLGKELALM